MMRGQSFNSDFSKIIQNSSPTGHLKISNTLTAVIEIDKISRIHLIRINVALRPW